MFNSLRSWFSFVPKNTYKYWILDITNIQFTGKNKTKDNHIWEDEFEEIVSK
jgi:hypothetical protein